MLRRLEYCSSAQFRDTENVREEHLWFFFVENEKKKQQRQQTTKHSNKNHITKKKKKRLALQERTSQFKVGSETTVIRYIMIGVVIDELLLADIVCVCV